MISDPRTLGPSDLVWDHFSRPRFDDLPARIRAARLAGFAAIGLYIGQWEQIRSSPVDLEAIDAALAETGIGIANIEVARGWASPDTADENCTKLELLAYEMATRFNCRYLQVIGDYTGSLAEAARGFAGLCDRAGEQGLLVGLEWVPQMTNIEDCATALQIVLEADRPNGGLCVDSWHLVRSTNRVEDLLAIPGEKVLATQWNDGPIAPQDTDYKRDCLSNRLPPGEGEFDLVDMIRALDSIGSTAPLGLEVPSTALWGGSVEDAANHAATAMRQVVAIARG
jgi:sugar phosphate isomerase/epimerase